MKKIISVLLTVALLLVMCPLSPTTTITVSAETSGDFTYTVKDDGTAKITKYAGSASTIVIPDTLGGFSVTELANGAFGDCLSLTSVTIPDSVVYIGGSSFGGCTNLSHIEISDNTVNILNGAFEDTAYYKDSNNWEDGVLYISNHLIDADTSISGEYTVKAGTKAIGNTAFAFCRQLTAVHIPDSVTSIGASSFSFCGLVTMTVPDSVTRIGEGAFSYCNNLSELILPDHVLDIETTILFASSYAEDDSNWENGGLYIGKHLLDADQSVSGAYTVKDGTLSIADYTFDGCKSLTSISIPASVRFIGRDMFYGTTDTTNSEGDYDYYLTDIYYQGTEADWTAIQIDESNDVLNNATLHCQANTSTTVTTTVTTTATTRSDVSASSYDVLNEIYNIQQVSDSSSTATLSNHSLNVSASKNGELGIYFNDISIYEHPYLAVSISSTVAFEIYFSDPNNSKWYGFASDYYPYFGNNSSSTQIAPGVYNDICLDISEAYTYYNNGVFPENACAGGMIISPKATGTMTITRLEFINTDFTAATTTTTATAVTTTTTTITRTTTTTRPTVIPAVKFGADRFTFGEVITGFIGDTVNALAAYTSVDNDTSALTITSDDTSIVEIGTVAHGIGDYLTLENEHMATIPLIFNAAGTATVTVTSPEDVSVSVFIVVYPDEVTSEETTKYIQEHLAFANANKYSNLTTNAGFYHTIWQHEEGSHNFTRYAAWDVIGRVGKFAAFDFYGTFKTDNPYDAILVDLFRSYVGNKQSKVAKAAGTAISATLAAPSVFDSVLSMLKTEDGWNDDLTKDWLKFTGDIQSKWIDGVLFEESTFDLNDYSPELYKACKNVFSKITTQSGYEKIFKNIKNIGTITDYITAGGDIVYRFFDAYQKYLITEALVETNKYVLSSVEMVAKGRMDGENSTLLLDAMDPYWEAYNEDSTFVAVCDIMMEDGFVLAAGNAAYTLLAKNLLQGVAYAAIYQVANIPAFALTATYNLTYMCLDYVTGLGKLEETHTLMNAAALFEKEYIALAKENADTLLSDKTPEAAATFDTTWGFLQTIEGYCYHTLSAYLSAFKQEYATNYIIETAITKNPFFAITDGIKLSENLSACDAAMQSAVYMESEWTNSDCHKETYSPSNLMTVKCPTDVFVYDSENNLVLSIVDNEVTSCADHIVAFVDVDEKIFVLPTDQEYDVKITATDDGTMDYAVKSFKDIELLRTVRYDDVELVYGDSHTADVPTEILADNEQYNLKTETGEEISADFDSLEPITTPSTTTTTTVTTTTTKSVMGETVTYSVGSVAGTVGSNVQVPITVSENHYMVNGRIIVRFDPTVLEIQTPADNVDCPYFDDLNTDIVRSASWAMTELSDGALEFGFASQSTVGSSIGGTIFTLTFKILDDAADDSVIVLDIPEMLSNNSTINNGHDYNTNLKTVDGVISLGTPATASTTTTVTSASTTTTTSATTFRTTSPTSNTSPVVLTVESTSSAPDDVFEVIISFGGTNRMIESFDFDLLYDNNVLTCVDAVMVENGLIGHMTYSDADYDEQGIVNIFAHSFQAVIVDSIAPIAIVTFRVNRTAEDGVYPLTFDNINLRNHLGKVDYQTYVGYVEVVSEPSNFPLFSILPAVFSVESATVGTNGVFDVVISLGGTNQTISSLEFDLLYDSDALTCIDAVMVEDGLIGRMAYGDTYYDDPGIVSMYAHSLQEVTIGHITPIAIITFRVNRFAADEVYPLTFDNISIKGDHYQVDYETYNGYVEITSDPITTTTSTTTTSTTATTTTTTTSTTSTTTTSTTTTTEMNETVKGDLNGDGKVTIMDAVQLYYHVNGKTLLSDDSGADINGDGNINIKDAVSLYYFVNGKLTTL